MALYLWIYEIRLFNTSSPPYVSLLYRPLFMIIIISAWNFGLNPPLISPSQFLTSLLWKYRVNITDRHLEYFYLLWESESQYFWNQSLGVICSDIVFYWFILSSISVLLIYHLSRATDDERQLCSSRNNYSTWNIRYSFLKHYCFNPPLVAPKIEHHQSPIYLLDTFHFK